jgi:muramoyltetrapeptide carboxypeptidase
VTKRLAVASGDLIDVVSPSFAVLPERLRSGVTALEAMGFRVRLGAHVLDQDGYLAGTDAARLDDLQRALDAQDSSAVWFSRGGYGAARLIDGIRWTRLARRPKLLIGHSDLSVLLQRASRAMKRSALHGPFVSELGDPASFHAPSLLDMLACRPVSLPIAPENVLVPGFGTGKLAGGNLTVLCHALGTRYEPETRGCVLLLEDVGEEAYRLDRMLQQLRLARVLERARAVLLGSFDAPPTRRTFPADLSVERVLRDALPGDTPVVRGLPLGHLAGKWTVPLCGEASVDTEAGTIVFTPRP